MLDFSEFEKIQQDNQEMVEWKKRVSGQAMETLLGIEKLLSEEEKQVFNIYSVHRKIVYISDRLMTAARMGKQSNTSVDRLTAVEARILFELFASWGYETGPFIGYITKRESLVKKGGALNEMVTVSTIPCAQETEHAKRFYV